MIMPECSLWTFTFNLLHTLTVSNCLCNILVEHVKGLSAIFKWQFLVHQVHLFPFGKKKTTKNLQNLLKFPEMKIALTTSIYYIKRRNASDFQGVRSLLNKKSFMTWLNSLGFFSAGSPENLSLFPISY